MRRQATNHRKREGTRTQRRITGANDARCMEGWVFYAESESHLALSAAALAPASGMLPQQTWCSGGGCKNWYMLMSAPEVHQQELHVQMWVTRIIVVSANWSRNEQRVTAFTTSDLHRGAGIPCIGLLSGSTQAQHRGT
ncbi:hypothetical protein BKA93DRAFT_749591 [Sparassis latifolia]